jgi:UDP-N-acetylglucosamine 4,6-dehydratase
MRILITGGTGTFGRMAARHLLEQGHIVTVMSRDEMKQEAMEREFDHPALRCFLGDVRDVDRLTRAMLPQEAVIHAAALKIVPRCEFDPFEAVKTNVHGTENVISAALATGVKKAIFIATDKCVEPINLYGATKKVAEHMWLAANNYAKDGAPAFSAVRYGNVWGSRGSVIPFWRECLKVKRPLPVTDMTMTRFFMFQRDAVALVEHALEHMSGGEIYIPRLPAYLIRDLLAAFQARFGICEAITTGLRLGEKMHESLASSHELPFMHRDGGGPLVLTPYSRQPWQEVVEPLLSNTAPRLEVEALTSHMEVFDDA